MTEALPTVAVKKMLKRQGPKGEPPDTHGCKGANNKLLKIFLAASPITTITIVKKENKRENNKQDKTKYISVRRTK